MFEIRDGGGGSGVGGEEAKSSLTSAKASRKEAKEALDAATAKWDEVRRREFIREPLAGRDGVVIEMGVLELEKKNH